MGPVPVSTPGWTWKKGLTAPLPRYAPIVPRANRGPVELSFGQQRLWLLAQFESGSAAYNVPLVWRIEGALDPTALQDSLDRLVARHEALRTTFPAEAGYPLQAITAPQPVTLKSADLRKVDPAKRDSALDRLLREETQRPFDLAFGPVMRAALFRTSDQAWVFVLTLHHIVCDGPSIAILLEELGVFYEAFAQGRAENLVQSPVQYADFALWQREALGPEIRDSQLAYWNEQLRDCPTALDFSTDRPRLAEASFRGGMEYLDLAPDLSDRFRSLARAHGVTRFMALLALFQVLLSRHTSQEDVVVGCPMTHRVRTEVSRVVGFFANMMVLRSQLEGNPTFRELLRRTREVALGAYAHQDLPFEQLVAQLQPERLPGLNPFFQAMLVVEESAWRELDLAGLKCRSFPIHNGTAKFDLSLYVIDHPRGFRLALEFNSDLFPAETASRLLQHYANLLQGAVDHPEGRVFELPLLSLAEQEQVLRQWNDTREDYPQPNCVPALFEAQADRAPDAVAIRFQDQTLTYRELNARANRLARDLVRRGAGAEVLVAVCLERSVDLVVALLAVLKSGSAYLPLDPAHPDERRAAILQASAAKIVVTDPGCPAESDDNLEVEIAPDDLAYVIYTSGSTGEPKGVEVEHQSLTNLLCSMRKRPGLEPNDVLLAVTTTAFDIAGLELWLPLTTGASVVLASGEEAADPYRLSELLETSRATVMQATPATWQMLLAAGWRGNRRLQVLCGGESLSGTLAHELAGCCQSVWNLYGPTETTIWSSLYQVTQAQAEIVPIGRPIGNTTMYVLDQNMEPVPNGVRGELYIGGAGVARGYLGKPGLTSEKFVPDRFSSNGRLYRTGDLVRQRRDGIFEFLGRLDRQVKIRGYRIEPAEIEAALGEYPGVRQVAVTVRGSAPESRLIAYVVSANQSSHVEQADLRGLLGQKLPGYMVPSDFVMLDALPLTPNGKIDWKALPAPENRAQETTLVPARDSVETRLVSLWEELLEIDPVGVRDNFFELGGHSLLAIRLLARIEKEFGRRLPLGTLFEAPMIEKLAAILRQESWTPSALIPVQAGDSSLPPIFFVQARVGYRALAEELGPQQPVYLIPYDDLFLDGSERSLTEIAAELASRIRRQQPHGPYYLGGWCLAGRVAFAIARELYRNEEEVALLAIIDMPAPRFSQLSRISGLRGFIDRVQWHLRYALQSNHREKRDWIAGGFHALVWQSKYRSWQLARLFFRRLGRPLPRSLRDATRLMAEAARKDQTTSYPGRVILFRPSEKTFVRYDQRDLGWGRIAARGVEIHEIPGLKRALLRANATAVGRCLKESLMHAQSSSESELFLA